MTPDLQAALETVRKALPFDRGMTYHAEHSHVKARAALALIEQRLGELERELQCEQDEAFFKGGGMSAKERNDLEARIEVELVLRKAAYARIEALERERDEARRLYIEDVCPEPEELDLLGWPALDGKDLVDSD